MMAAFCGGSMMSSLPAVTSTGVVMVFSMLKFSLLPDHNVVRARSWRSVVCFETSKSSGMEPSAAAVASLATVSAAASLPSAVSG